MGGSMTFRRLVVAGLVLAPALALSQDRPPPPDGGRRGPPGQGQGGGPPGQGPGQGEGPPDRRGPPDRGQGQGQGQGEQAVDATQIATAMDKGVQWLLSRQGQDGSWDEGYKAQFP